MARFKSITLEWSDDRVIFIDQRRLPVEEVYVECRTHEEVYSAIKDMVVRGAPAIGASAAFGYVLGAMEFDKKPEELAEHMEAVKNRLAESRPTAVNLFWALERMERLFAGLSSLNPEELIKALEREAIVISREDILTNRSIGKNGSAVVRDGDGILTHCNAGALATVDYGTALGVIRSAVEMGKRVRVYADETRPYLQGARLTSWEL